MTERVARGSDAGEGYSRMLLQNKMCRAALRVRSCCAFDTQHLRAGLNCDAPQLLGGRDTHGALGRAWGKEVSVPPEFWPFEWQGESRFLCHKFQWIAPARVASSTIETPGGGKK